MFKAIEKEYKKNLKKDKFNKVYWFTAIFLTITSSIFNFSETNRLLFIYLYRIIGSCNCIFNQ